MEKSFKFIPFFVVFVVLLVSIGYSAFQSNGIIHEAGATVRPQTNIRITNITVDSTTSATVNGLDYSKENTMSDVTFTSTSSQVRYRIEITNFGNTEMGLASIDGLASGLEAVNDETSYAMGTKLCDATNTSQCTLGSKTYLYVTIKYPNGGGSNTSTDLAANLHFNFRTVHKVYYSSNEIGYVLDGGNKSFTLSSPPAAVTVSGTLTSSSYTSPTISLVGVMSDIYIDSSGPAEGGTYDPDNPTEGDYVYSSTPGAPEVVVENGEVTSYEYTDTSGTYFSNSGADTGFVPFESNKNFEIRMHARFPASTNMSNNSIALDIRDRSGGVNTALQVGYFSRNYFRVYINAPAAPGGQAVNSQYNLTLDSNNCFDIVIRYENYSLTVTNYGVQIYSGLNNVQIPNMTLLIGRSENSSGNPLRPAQDLTVYEFYVREI